jgi:hypothetical protein
MRYALECQMQFLFEEWTEAYTEYAEGIPQKKIVYGAREHQASPASPGLSWCVA